MNCLEFRKSLLLHVGRELPDEREREIRLHLESCPCCQRRARYEERFQSVLRDRLAPPPLPTGLRERICHRLEAEDRSAPPRPRGSLLLRPSLVYAIGLLLLLSAAAAAGVFLSWRGGLGDAATVHLRGRLVCLRCEREGLPPSLHRRSMLAEHPAGLKTPDGRVLALDGAGALPLQDDPTLLGRKVEVEGVLDPRTGILEVIRHTLPDERPPSGRSGAPGAFLHPVL